MKEKINNIKMTIRDLSYEYNISESDRGNLEIQINQLLSEHEQQQKELIECLKCCGNCKYFEMYYENTTCHKNKNGVKYYNVCNKWEQFNITKIERENTELTRIKNTIEYIMHPEKY